MSKNSRPPSSARGSRERVEEMRKVQQAKDRRARFLIIGAVGAVILLIVGVVGVTVYRDVSSRPTLEAIKTFTVTGEHTTAPVTYEQSPPVGGDHNAIWLNCGVYPSAVPNELAVHALEHGAVWVTYSPDLPADQVTALKEAIPDTYMVLSPFEGLTSPVVASAWGAQLELTGADDPRLEEFISTYRQGPQTPEPGAACTGGSDGEIPMPTS
ncbi:MAG: DUF3105 domain-containing protein [Ornithinibacter sp.]